MFRKILVPVDGSEHSEKALSLVEELASKFGSEVLVLHVREKWVGRGGSYDVDLTEEDVNVATEAAQKLAGKGVSAKPRDRLHCPDTRHKASPGQQTTTVWM